MDASQTGSYSKLTSSLDELIKLYRNLLDIVRKEKEALLQSQIDIIHENNKAKEGLLAKIRATDLVRERYARDLAQAVGSDAKTPRLLEIAQKMTGVGASPDADRLRQLHSILVLLIERVAEINKANAQYAENALKTLSMALGDVKSTLGGKKVYERKGKLNEGPNRAGNFVSKEA